MDMGPWIIKGNRYPPRISMASRVIAWLFLKIGFVPLSWYAKAVERETELEDDLRMHERISTSKRVVESYRVQPEPDRRG